MKITLKLIEDVWHATYSGSGAQDIIDAFDTDTVPTPYTSKSSAIRVLGDIQRKNPNAYVVLAK